MFSMVQIGIAVGGVLLVSGIGYKAGASITENKFLKREAAAVEAAVAERTQSLQEQLVAANADRGLLLTKAADLTRFLREREDAEVPTGRNCIVERDAIELRNDHFEIFEDRLLAGGGADSAAASPSTPTNDD